MDSFCVRCIIDEPRRLSGGEGECCDIPSLFDAGPAAGGAAAALRQLFEDKVRLDIDAAPGHAVEMSMNVGPGLRRARMLSSFTARLERPRRGWRTARTAFAS